MNAFDDVKLNWKGKDYTIRSQNVLSAIARVESVVTFHELMQYSERQTAPLATLAAAYGILLRFAGADLTDEAIYQGMFSNLGDDTISVAIQTLLFMMIPKSRQPSVAVGKSKPAASRRVKGSSKPRGKR